MILPLVAFPARLGLDLARPSVMHWFYEIVFYGLIIYLFHRRVSLIQLLGAAAACLAYRLTIGAVFGFFIAAMYSMELGVSLRLGISSYLPAILFHVLLAPLVLRPILGRWFETKDKTASRSEPPDSESSPVADSISSSEPVSWEHTAVASSSAPPPVMKAPERTAEPARKPESTVTPEPTPVPTDQDLSGFDKAVYYIGEHSSVHLAAVVDEEGLLLGNFTRRNADAEAWAPMALLFLQGDNEVLARADLDGVERLELQLKEVRIVVGRSEGCNLIVVSERHDDDLLNIRINQGLEMINRLVVERYADKLNSNAERIHVSSAQ